MADDLNKFLDDDVEIEAKVESVKTMSAMEEEITKMASDNGWVVNDKALEAIVSSKVQNFGLEDWSPCPCDMENSARYCGSELCAEEIEENGICHCGLFKKE